MSVYKMNADNFESFKKGLDGGKVAVLKFWASWCGPCVRYASVFEEVSKKLGDNVIFAEVNIDEDEKGILTNAFNIRSIPATLLVDSEMKVINRITGSVDADNLEGFILSGKGIE